MHGVYPAWVPPPLTQDDRRMPSGRALPVGSASGTHLTYYAGPSNGCAHGIF
jgi:hypothetical protein